MQKLKVAVIGCGHWGKNLIRNFANLGVLKYVCDSDPLIAYEIAKRYNVETKSLKDILLFVIALLIIISILSEWAFEARSGTIPPNGLWILIWLDTILDNIFALPFLSLITTDAAVSSQLVSIPKKINFFFINATSGRLNLNTITIKNKFKVDKCHLITY